MKRLLLVLAVIVSFTTSAGSGRTDRSITQHKEFALQTKFDFACGLNGGSATLIDPFWVITANHVSTAKADGDNTLNCFSFEKDKNGEYKKIRHVVARAEQKNNLGEYEFPYFNDRGFGDFALVRLDTPVIGIKPARLPTRDMIDYDKTYTVTQIGFGNYDGRNGGNKQVIYSAYEDRWLAEYSHTPNVMQATELNWLAIHGDSGSGITIERDGEHYIIGEIGLQYSTQELGWSDTFDDVIARLPFIKETIKSQSFAYAEVIDFEQVRWEPQTQESIENLHAGFSHWWALNVDFNGTEWKESGELYSHIYADSGQIYSIEAVIPEGIAAFDLFVNGRHVAHNIDATEQSLKVTVNAFKQMTDLIKIEFRPINPTGERIILDHLIVKEHQPK
ncbi:trypsin-like serine peptidase [Vibrio scophthalmi]|uniref:Peptidase S1 domain-containing protein n=1 Tax=Vibrio scophthalmi LMG 19158 TaxID=870967 RepID=F9RVX3_9VIBR|nr:trypsin-like serine protease [Vibrio scophthalmi]EGU29299.1 hypothetical protein VIS19158_20666 [Vibrio scophthalmi LMG 19158]